MYELAGYRYEGMNFGRNISYRIGSRRTAEAHIFQINSSMPTELATVQWFSMASPDYSTFVPFYGALLTDVSKAYKTEAHVPLTGSSVTLVTYVKRQMTVTDQTERTMGKV